MRMLIIVIVLSLSSSVIAQQTGVDSLTLLLSTDLHDTLRINIQNKIGRKLMYSMPDSALRLAARGLKLATSIEWNKGIARSTGLIGSLHFVKGNYPLALEHMFKTLTMLRETDTTDTKSGILGNIGAVYHTQGDLDKALEFYIRARIASALIFFMSSKTSSGSSFSFIDV